MGQLRAEGLAYRFKLSPKLSLAGNEHYALVWSEAALGAEPPQWALWRSPDDPPPSMLHVADAALSDARKEWTALLTGDRAFDRAPGCVRFGDIVFVTLHASLSPLKARAEAVAVQALLSAASAEGTPVVALGDVNADAVRTPPAHFPTSRRPARSAGRRSRDQPRGTPVRRSKGRRCSGATWADCSVRAARLS